MTATGMFVREFEVETTSVVLKIHQCSVGDVGAVVWDAGIVLGKYLDHMERRTFLLNKKVLELGAGTGIVGLVACTLGANVIMTDLPELVPLLEMNVKANESLFKGSAMISSFKWGEQMNLQDKPDLILLSDCIYYKESIGDLLKSLINLSGLKTEILISYEDRTSKDKKEILESFFKRLSEKFSIDEIPFYNHNPLFRSPDIHILSCKRVSL